MHDHVVPRRHLTVRDMLARIPVRRDVRIAGAEDHEHVVAVRDFLPQRIRSRDVRMQLAEAAVARQQLERQMIRVEAARAVRDEAAERMLDDQLAQRVGVRFGEIGRDIHGGSTVGRGSADGPAWASSCADCARKLVSSVEPVASSFSRTGSWPERPASWQSRRWAPSGAPPCASATCGSATFRRPRGASRHRCRRRAPPSSKRMHDRAAKASWKRAAWRLRSRRWRRPPSTRAARRGRGRRERLSAGNKRNRL